MRSGVHSSCHVLFLTSISRRFTNRGKIAKTLSQIYFSGGDKYNLQGYVCHLGVAVRGGMISDSSFMQLNFAWDTYREREKKMWK